MADQARLAPAARSYRSAEQAASVYGAAPADLDAVAAFAAAHGLEVIERSAARRSVRITGTVAAMNEAFGIELHTCRHPDGTT